jgi:hypothetical protein
MGLTTTGNVRSVTDDVINALEVSAGIVVWTACTGAGVFFAIWHPGRFVSAVSHAAEGVAARWHRR